MIDTTAHPNRLRDPASLAQGRWPLENGDRLTRAEFERRYAVMPHIKTAELIEGEVHRPSPVQHVSHGKPHAQLLVWLGTYSAATPGVDLGDNVTVRLDQINEVQPDALLRLEKGQSRISADDYIEGAPELVAEIASSSVAIDLHRKLQVYLRSGVQEYLVWRTLDEQLDWFELREGEYVPLAPDEQGRPACAAGSFPACGWPFCRCWRATWQRCWRNCTRA
jgi:Uma2 family endonuclease